MPRSKGPTFKSYIDGEKGQNLGVSCKQRFQHPTKTRSNSAGIDLENLDLTLALD